MTSAATIVDDLRTVIQMLVDLNNDATTRAAAVLTRLLAGEDFEAAANLPPGWRRQLQQKARDAALCGLLKLLPNISDRAMAARIVAGVARAARKHGDRPDGEAGYFHDLARLDECCEERQWRRLIAEQSGQSNACIGQQPVAPSAPQEKLNGST